ncbi:hypothetical protein EON65_42625 [archaeon]|nr:MAG: hypothetical protein EON65_42625 [archaeon]
MDKIQAYLAKSRNLILFGATVLSLSSLSLLWVYRKRVVKLLRGSGKKRRPRKKNGSVNIGGMYAVHSLIARMLCL